MHRIQPPIQAACPNQPSPQTPNNNPMKTPRIHPKPQHSLCLAFAILAGGLCTLKAAWTLDASGQWVDDHVLATASDLIITGDLSVWKGVDAGTAVTVDGSTSLSALQLYYCNTTGSLYKTAVFDLTDPTASFLWRQDLGAAGLSPKNKMKLDGSNILSLYDSTGNSVTILLDGDTGTITSDGNPVLTEASVLPSGFLSSSNLWPQVESKLKYSYSISLTSGTANGNYSTAMSGGIAGGYFSTAMSGGSTDSSADSATAMSAGTAGGYFSTAMSWGTANGGSSTAMSGGFTDFYAGYSTAMSDGIASYEFATAMSGGFSNNSYATAMSGGYTDAPYSTAMTGGYTDYVAAYSTAMSGGQTLGEYTLASGYLAKAQSYSSASFGRFNEDTGFGDIWVETDPVLSVGNGSDYLNASNALVVLKNGQTSLINKAWKSATGAAPTDPEAPLADYGTTASGGNALVVDGHTVLNGKVVISVPQGDISMGIYQ